MPHTAILVCTILFWNAWYRMRKTANGISWKHFIPDSPFAHSSHNPQLLEEVLSSLCYSLVQRGDRRFWPNVWSCHMQDHLVFEWDEIMCLLKISLYQVWRDLYNIYCMLLIVIWYIKNEHTLKNISLAPVLFFDDLKWNSSDLLPWKFYSKG